MEPEGFSESPMASCITSSAIKAIARACHEVNRTYCDLIGDHSQAPWADAPEWQRESADTGIRRVLAGDSPEQLHESWREQKRLDGWVYGPEKDANKKTHPCMVPYTELSSEQRVKDTLFLQTARSLLVAANLV